MTTAGLLQPAPAIMTSLAHSHIIQPQLHIKIDEEKKGQSAKEP